MNTESWILSSQEIGREFLVKQQRKRRRKGDIRKKIYHHLFLKFFGADEAGGKISISQ